MYLYLRNNNKKYYKITLNCKKKKTFPLEEE